MEALLQRQCDILETIKKIDRNYGKDSATRKTRKYVEDRLDALDRLWAEFQLNNEKLAPYENATEPYFVENDFERTRKYFDSVRHKIASTSIVTITEPESPARSPMKPPAPQPEGVYKHPQPQTSRYEAPRSDKTTQCEELLSLQRTSFRAFRRLVRSLSVDELTDKWELEDELRNIQTRWHAIDTLHIQIDNILQGIDSTYEEEFYVIEESYKTVKRALNKKLASTAHLQQSTPRLEIPTFSGSYLQWPTFYDLYIETIHNNNLLTKSQKMQHLKGKLRGEAERIIQHLSITAENYDTAWELLLHRYNNPQLIFTKHIELFLSQPNLQKQSSHEIKRLYDTSSECIHAIENLGVDIGTWDPLLVHLIVKKLDSETYTDYKEARKSPRDLPKLKELMDFLEAKFTALEPIHKRERDATPNIQKPYQQRSIQYPQQGSSYRQGRFPNREYQSSATYTWSCPLCNQGHVLFRCSKFNKLSIDAKLQTVTKLNVCKNCLYIHTDNVCNSTRRCKQCHQPHNTILHEAISRNADTAHESRRVQVALPTSMAPSTVQHQVNHVATDDEEILLTTLSIKIKGSDGTYTTLRALLDQGSQITLISERAAQQLGLARQNYHASVSGIGHGSKQSKGVVTLDCSSIYDDYQFSTQALVINRVINNLPNMSFNKQQWLHLNHIQLADPDYNISKPIDLLLDASVYSDIIMSGLIKGSSTAPIAQQTKLGWILSGNVRTFNCHVAINNVHDLAQYWELEEIQDTTCSLTQDEQYCEQIYQQTTRRLSDGRYEVAIPMKQNFEQKLGNSKAKAIAQLYNLEKKMSNNETFSDSYIQFMREYEAMGHMKKVHNYNQISCYLPHHGVFKADSTTTRHRTVFNAASKTTTGYSLNDLMERGPNLQKDLHSLILVWRQHRYVITADIEKMFRQVLIRESDQHLQRIVWRYSPHDNIQDYQLVTVTYGTKSAPYLTMRTLKQLALDDAHKFPIASRSLMTSFYMDDLLEGDNTIEDTRLKQQQIIEILKGAGMNIRKWSSNTVELTKGLNPEQLDNPLEFKCSETKKTLGIRWNPSSDTFTFQNKFQEQNDDKSLTKRQLLSNISKVFDPLGWLSPITIRAKLLFQRTWSQETLDWDEEISNEMKLEWQQLRLDFQNLEQFTIPRYIGDKGHYIIHGFCDSSEKAYACSIYIVTKTDKGEYTSTLLTAKTKLAPVKNKLTLPRLELCGALLLSKLMKKVMESFAENTQMLAWTDSMVVLGWIHGDVQRWKQFVANRVQKIVEVIPATNWNHVKSEQNSSDCATRGLTAKQLSEFSLWWEGPEWIRRQQENKKLSKRTYQLPTIETKKMHNVNTALCTVKNDLVNTLINSCSNLDRVVTTICWLRRFKLYLCNTLLPCTKYITGKERQISLNLIIGAVQALEFGKEINSLRRIDTNSVKSTSKLSSFCPYIDKKDGILKIGGRLNNSSLKLSTKHPAILPSQGRLTELIIQQAHATTLHGGPRLTLSYIRERYWILSGLRTVKREIRKCVKCRRYSVEQRSQIMADLPQPRVTPSRPFSHTGVDFTGHFEVKANKGRGIKTLKGYVAVFICLATKAIHLELVSDLSTQGFLAAFRRFCARRGTPSHMYSDNGTNFVGANRLLKTEYQEILRTFNHSLMKNMSDLQIVWKFNAPAYPSAGGLWEAAVKSFKHHLRRVIGEQKLTFEEFNTLLHQIEACLNSRPLISLTENPDDDYLTPGHFLIGASLLTRPQTEPDNMCLTSRWQMVQNMNKQFWKKWSSDYLQSLQSRTKWRKPTPNMKVDDIVLIKEDNIPPGKWLLGRITDVHPGKDGRVRVVTLKTKNGVMKRPILKLTYLPVNEESQLQQVTAQPTDSGMKDDVIETRDSPAQTVPPRHTRRTRCNFLTMMLLCLSIFTPIRGSYNITTFDKNQDIYFDKMYDMSIIRDQWNLVIYYNMSTYLSGINRVQDYITNINNRLLNSHDPLPMQYKSIIYQLQQTVDDIKHYNLLINNQIGKRQKRGLINGVGYLANSLFGVLDERFCEKYEQDIKKISLNENHLQNLLKNQTSIIEAQANILHRNEITMNKQFKTLQKHLEEITLLENRSQAEIHNELYVLSSLLAAGMIVTNIKNIQESLISTVLDIARGHSDAHLLSPEQLEEHISIIYSNLPTDLTLPVEKDNLRELYKIMKTNVRVGSTYLIIETKIPLVDKQTFQLDRMISLPHSTYFIEPSVPYIAFNLANDRLILFTEADIQECIHIDTSYLLCHSNKPIYEVPITKSICNLSINNKSLCRAIQTACEERWLKLHNNNKWLFTCCEECDVRIFCLAEQVQMKTLYYNGLLDIEQGCSIKGNTYSIKGHNNYLSYTQIQSNVPIVPQISILNEIQSEQKTNITLEISEYDEKGWLDMKKQIDILKEQAQEPLSIHDVHHYVVQYTTIVLLLLGLIIFFIIRRYKHKRQQRLAKKQRSRPQIVLVPSPEEARPRVNVDRPITHAAKLPKSLSRPTPSDDKDEQQRPRSIRLDIPSESGSQL